jgi:hypothetical protein
VVVCMAVYPFYPSGLGRRKATRHVFS